MKGFSLTLFSTDAAFIKKAVSAGVDEIIVDWERRGKAERQSGFDTEINADTVADLRLVRSSTRAKVICRINQSGPTTGEEIEQAIEGQANEILMPMVRSVSEVEAALKRSDGRCGIGILVETVAALQILDPLSDLPLSRVYVGLNDLSIERGKPSIFEAILDGTVESIRSHFRVPFGFGGLTLPEGGHPIPCRLLMGEMARLGCAFSFLRRSFYRDIQGRDPGLKSRGILRAMQQAQARPFAPSPI